MADETSPWVDRYTEIKKIANPTKLKGQEVIISRSSFGNIESSDSNIILGFIASVHER